MKTANVARFDKWIRGDFRSINTRLEELYFGQADRTVTAGLGIELKEDLCGAGHRLLSELVAEGNTDEGFDQNFDLLGNVGFFMSACTRHGVEQDIPAAADALRRASALALELGACIGVAPRFSSSHLMTRNPAVNGVYKTFTSLADERLFIEQNTVGVLAYKRAAEALLRIQPLGISHPLTPGLLRTATDALGDVQAANRELFERLDPDRFFFNVRPYYKSHRVGFSVYRGANAGDFAGINVIDLLTGLCQSNEASYSQFLVDKFLYMMPEDQLLLRDCMRRQSLLNQFIAAAGADRQTPWFQTSAVAFLEVCDAHGAAARQHHDELVEKFIAQPAARLPADRQEDLTASGPPLTVVMAALRNLRDQRSAVPRTDIATRYKDIEELRRAVHPAASRPDTPPASGL